jgi:hypothetical protein
LGINTDSIFLVNCPAKAFFENNLNVDYFSTLFSDGIEEKETLPV